MAAASSFLWPPVRRQQLPQRLRPFLHKVTFFTGCVVSLIFQVGVAAPFQQTETRASLRNLGFPPASSAMLLGDSPHDTPGHEEDKLGAHRRTSDSLDGRVLEPVHADSKEEELDDDEDESVSVPVDKRLAKHYRLPLDAVDTRRYPHTKKAGNRVKILFSDMIPGGLTVGVLAFLLWQRHMAPPQLPDFVPALRPGQQLPPPYEPWTRVAANPN
ncbi:putative transmembrane protein [Toxoplasma gondii RUB]|uniref:Putative transmembrane protein n=2 Tax=Toxoplasma gondii TaxID=5811 RepID=A0A086M0G7_TOXGO|nr:putative transmembrane protein [Toxoplasma gondii RUB]KFH07538.1 putative transmembrane protein [Toxoplasma gondii VAND]